MSAPSVVYGHFDIEADGKTPAHSNMISFAVVFTEDDGKFGKIVDELLLDIKQRPGKTGDRETLDWWIGDSKRKAEFERIMNNGLSPQLAMDKFHEKVGNLRQKYV
jgi:hypothetical protein